MNKGRGTWLKMGCCVLASSTEYIHGQGSEGWRKCLMWGDQEA